MARAIIQRGLRSSGSAWKYKEVVLGGNSGRDVTQLLEWLLGRQPLVADLSSGTRDNLAPAVKAVLQRKLPERQARRVELNMLGHQLDEIAAEEEHRPTKQAVWASLQRAYTRLGADDDFLTILVHHVLDDLSEDPDEASAQVRFWIRRLREMKEER